MWESGHASNNAKALIWGLPGVPYIYSFERGAFIFFVMMLRKNLRSWPCSLFSMDIFTDAQWQMLNPRSSLTVQYTIMFCIL